MNENPPIPGRADSSECPPEWIISVYVDRELDADITRSTEAHLIRCRACRERVIALEDEVSLLRRSLRLGEIAEAQVIRAAPARGFAIGVGPAIAVAFVCLTALGWVIETKIPSAVEWLNPIDLAGAFRMFFTTVFMLRDESPAIYQIVVSSAALFSFAFLLTTSVTVLARRLASSGASASLLIASLLSLGMLPAPSVSAVELIHKGEKRIIPAGEVVESTWLVSADEVVIAGTLRGDLFVVAERVVISGELDGDLIGGARKIEVSGHITGSIAVIGERIRVSGQIDRNAYTAAEEMVISESGQIGRDLVAGGDEVELSGEVGRDVMTFSKWLEARGVIGGDLDAHADSIEIAEEARIGGDLHAKFFENEERLTVAPGAVIGGTTTSEIVEVKHRRHMDRYSSPHFYIFMAVAFTAAFLAGMVMYRFAPWVFGRELGTGSEFFRALMYGFVALVACPLLLIVMALTVVGIPMAVMGLGLFGVCAYAAKIVVGGTIGMAIFGEPEDADWMGFGVPLAAGLGIVMVSAAIPFLGGVVGFVVLLTGLGMLVEVMRLRFWSDA